jgi:3-oxoacyl-[acyl-carrier-protein] synthase-3
MRAAIKAISYYLPPKVETNLDLSREFPEWSAGKIAEKTGISERHIAGEGVCASDLGFESVRKLFAEHGINPADIDFILLCTQSPDYLLPTTACLLQHRLGIPQTAGALDFNLGCSGFVYGLALAAGLVETQQARNVLLITAETYSKFISPSDKSVRSIFGDAAAATLVSASETGSIGPFAFGTDGRGGQHLIVKTSGLRQPKQPGSTAAVTTDEFGNIRSDDFLYMNGQEILSFTLRAVPRVIAALKQKSGLSDDRIDYYIFHQANKYMLELLRKKLKLPPEKFAECLAGCGNTVSCTIPIALCHALKSGAVGPSRRVMLVGFGVGLSWAAGLVEL